VNLFCCKHEDAEARSPRGRWLLAADKLINVKIASTCAARLLGPLRYLEGENQGNPGS
jgi:hypothetical protein